MMSDRRFSSILFPGVSDAVPEEKSAPEFFRDLYLDQIVDAVTAGRKDYGLAPFFYAPLHDLRTIMYRQDIMKDLEADSVMTAIRAFSSQMKRMRTLLPRADDHYRYGKERSLLSAVQTYCQAIEELARDLAELDLASEGMLAFRDHLAGYASSAPFQELLADTSSLLSALSSVRYCLLIKDSSITVRGFESEQDYSATVERTFEKFRRNPAKDYRAKDLRSRGMNHVQELVVEQVARLYPETFEALKAFYTNHLSYLDETIARFDREIQFYVAYLEHIGVLRQAGLSFCYPRLSEDSKETEARDSFDLALAAQLLQDGASVVTNDFSLSGPERILVVSGPNQGGKTTFARMFGQVHYLASLGCPVPGAQASLFLFDRMFSHFERQEDIQTLRGKLAEELVHVHQILDQATANSIVIINEMFSSTMLKDAIYLSKNIIAEVSGLDALCVCVTFLDELASFNEKTVSIVGNIDPDNPSVRTFKLTRQPANGLAYALAIAQKYRLTYDWLKKRVTP